MTLHEYGGLSFELPTVWVEKTTLAFAAPGPTAARETNLRVTREKAHALDTVITFARRQLLHLAARVPQFELLEAEDFAIAGCRGTRSRVRWKGPKGVVEQAVAHIMSPEDESTILTFTCTSRPDSEFRSWTVLEALLATVRVGKERTPPADSGFFDIEHLPRAPMPAG
jgi:hypothetical protein